VRVVYVRCASSLLSRGTLNPSINLCLCCWLFVMQDAPVSLDGLQLLLGRQAFECQPGVMLLPVLFLLPIRAAGCACEPGRPAAAAGQTSM
jgi:hypothetical protein